jgi:hypothetical protein
MDAVGTTPAAGAATNPLPADAASNLANTTTASADQFAALSAQGTAQTLKNQLALIGNSLIVGPAFVAKAIADDAKRA